MGLVLGEDRYPSALTGLLAIDGMGNLIEIGEDDIKDWRGSLGLLGVVLAVEFEVKEDEGFEQIKNLDTFTGDDWNEEAIINVIREEIAGKLSFGLVWEYYSGSVQISTSREVGREAIDIESMESFYDEVIASVPDLSRNGGPKSPLLQQLAILMRTFLGGSALAGFLFNDDAWSTLLLNP